MPRVPTWKEFIVAVLLVTVIGIILRVVFDPPLITAAINVVQAYTPIWINIGWQVLFLFLGAGITYMVQMRVQNQQRLRELAERDVEHIYRPLYQEIQSALDAFLHPQIDWQVPQTEYRRMQRVGYDFRIPPRLRQALDTLHTEQVPQLKTATSKIRTPLYSLIEGILQETISEGLVEQRRRRGETEEAARTAAQDDLVRIARDAVPVILRCLVSGDTFPSEVWEDQKQQVISHHISNLQLPFQSGADLYNLIEQKLLENLETATLVEQAKQRYAKVFSDLQGIRDLLAQTIKEKLSI